MTTSKYTRPTMLLRCRAVAKGVIVGRFVACILVLMLAACSRTPESRDVPTITYRGLKLSLPKDSATEQAPSAAWLIVGNEVVPATYGNFTTRMHADAPPPHMHPDLATIMLPAAVRVTVVISAEAITAFQAHLRPWTA